jgi:hypothetical protein
MVYEKYHLGLRQVIMALMDWAIDVPQNLLQNDAILLLLYNFINNIISNKEELIMKER